MCFVEIFRADVKWCKFRERWWRTETAVLHIFDFVIWNEMLGYTPDGQGKGLQRELDAKRVRIDIKINFEKGLNLLHQAIWLELVAVRQATHESPLTMLINAHLTTITLRPAECLALELDAVNIILGLLIDVRRRRIGPHPSVTSSSLIRLAIEQEVAQNATRTPEKPVRPTLDAALILVKHKHRSRCNHLAFRINQAPGDAGYETTARGLKDQKSITSGLDPTRPRWFSPGTWGGLLVVALPGRHIAFTTPLAMGYMAIVIIPDEQESYFWKSLRWSATNY
jgi:hypothetical protein